MGLFEFSKELQFRVCNAGEPCVSPPAAKGRETLYGREEEVGSAIVIKDSIGGT